MLGSSASVSTPNIVLNTAVAETLKQFADSLEGVKDFPNALHALIKKTITEHKRIIFNGNGYDDAWIAEAEKRGLLNLKTTPEALPYFAHEKNVALFTSHKVFTEIEIRSRLEILLENYSKIIHIEANTMLDMTKRDILPAVSKYAKALDESVVAKKARGNKGFAYENETLDEVNELSDKAYYAMKALEKAVAGTSSIENPEKLALYYKDEVLPKMEALRSYVDALETLVSSEYWCYPTYGELLFGV